MVDDSVLVKEFSNTNFSLSLSMIFFLLIVRVLLLLHQIFSNMCARVLNTNRETHLLATCSDIKSGETLLFVGRAVALRANKPVCLSDVR